MKFILLIISLGLTLPAYSRVSSAQDKRCLLPVTNRDPNLFGFLKRQSNTKTEYPEGRCKLISKDYLRQIGLSCELAYLYLSEIDKDFSNNYNCYQITLSHTRKIINGMPAATISPVCFVCQNEELFAKK